MPVQKIKSGRVNTPIDSFVGDNGVIFFDEADGLFRLGDGFTPGGISLSAGDGSGFVLPTASTSIKGGVKIDGSTITIANQIISVGTLPYAKLSGTPLIPTNNSQLSNGAGYITNSALDIYALTSNIPTNNSQLSNGAGYITNAALSGLATETFVTTRGFLTTISYADVTNKPTLFSGNYQDLAGVPFIPTDIGQLTDNGNLLGSGGQGGSIQENSYSFNIAGDDSSLVEISNSNTVQFKGVNITVSATTDGVVTFTGPEAIAGATGAKGDTGETGATGQQGSAGIGVATAVINESGKLIVTLTNNSTIDTGSVISNLGNFTFVDSTIDSRDSSGIIFAVSSTFNSDLIIENDLIVTNQIRNQTGDIYATEGFVQQAVNELIGAAPEALNTLQELASALGNNENFATTILNALTAVSDTVRYDINDQNLTQQQQQNARTNIGAVSEADLYAAAIVMG